MRAGALPLLAVALAWPGAAAAQTAMCSASAQPVAFGTYDALVSVPADSAGNVRVTCQLLSGLGLTQMYAVSLSAGTSAQFAPRRMTGAGGTLDYNLYVDASRLLVWGDGRPGTVTVQDALVLTSLVPATRDHPVYGRLPARQPAVPGVYTDLILVTLDY